MLSKMFGRPFERWSNRPAGDQHTLEAKLMQAVLNEIGQAVWVDTLDKTRAVLNVGDYESLFDRPRENLWSDPLDWIKAIHPDDRPEIEAALPDQRQGKFDVKYRVVHRDGTTKWLRDRAFLLRDEAGAELYQAGIVTDITDRVELEELALHDQKVRAIGVLTGGICHDFNNVLAVVLGNIELSLDTKNPEEIEEHLQSARTACQRGADLTRRLLAYSRKHPLSPTNISPAPLLAQLEGLLRQSLSETIELEIISSAGIWSCKADESELQTVLLNIAINGQDAMAHGGKITIEVFNARIDEDYARRHEEVVPGQYLCFAVTDNGSGMSAETVALAFDPFFSTKEKGKGTGLGLSMAYGFAKQSGGHLKIYSEVGKGTTVKLYLPRSVDRELQQVVRKHDLGKKDLHGKSVLIVDNDADILRTVDLQMRAFGFETFPAESAEHALSVISKGKRFDLLLLDVVLGGGMSGPDLAKQLQAVLPGASTLLMTGFTENAVIHDGALDAGVTLVQKPFTRDELLLGVLRAMEMASK